MRSPPAAPGSDAMFYGARRASPQRGWGVFAGADEGPGGGRDELRIGLCVPMGGLTGIWGPSAMASARLAVAELNKDAGIGGKPCRLIAVDADDHAPHLESVLDELLAHGEIDALVGMHTSFVRQRIISAVHGRVPFVYTPLYEGGEAAPGVYAIGETPARQLRPAIHWLSRHERPRRWALIGNDYVWPHVSNQLARGYIAECGAQVVLEQYVPLGTTDYGQLLDQLQRSRADAVLISLIGHDAIEFNRAFGRVGLPCRALRLSAAIEENELLAIGADDTERLFVASSYFSTLSTDANLHFKERYHQHFGERAPTLNSLGQSTYEGVHFLASLFERELHRSCRGPASAAAPVTYRSAREGAYAGNGLNLAPVYLAVAQGHVFNVLTRL